MIFAPQVKLLLHSDRLKKWVETDRTNPILAEIAPTGYCNAACPWCFFKDRQTPRKINSKIMLDTISGLMLSGIRAINWTGGGEPTLHPDLKKFIGHASECGLKQGIFTNGYKIIPFQEKFEWIRISLTDKGFKKIKKPKVPFGICANHTKESHLLILDKLCREAKAFGASYFQVRPALVGSHKKQPQLLIPYHLKKYETKKFKVYITEYKYKESIVAKDYKHCYGYHFCLSIDWNGKVGTCLYMTDNPKFILGDLNKESFINIWEKVPKKVVVTKTCQNCCKNNQINIILSQIRKIKHIDFI